MGVAYNPLSTSLSLWEVTALYKNIYRNGKTVNSATVAKGGEGRNVSHGEMPSRISRENF